MNKTALITGASSGIGYELSQIFAMEGYNLVLTARNTDKLNELKNNLENQYNVQVSIITKDLALPDSSNEIYNEVVNKDIIIDVLVNNAGLGDFGLFHESDIDKVNNIIELNINSLTKMTRLFLPDMLKRKDGKILNIASLGSFQPGPLMAVYYASKAYVLSFSEAVSRELKNTGVTVTAVCPGPTNTEFNKKANFGTSGFIFNKHSASAKSVAVFSYKKMKKGKAVAVPGFFNKIASVGVRLLPKRIVRNMVYWLQKKRSK